MLTDGGVRGFGLVHSPLLPRSARGAELHALAHLVDWLPTFLNLATDGRWWPAARDPVPAADGCALSAATNDDRADDDAADRADNNATRVDDNATASTPPSRRRALTPARVVTTRAKGGGGPPRALSGKQLDGVDLWPVLRAAGSAAAPRVGCGGRSFLLLNVDEYYNQRAVLSERDGVLWKLYQVGPEMTVCRVRIISSRNDKV